MTDVTGRNRVQGGVPTGGQFATEAKGENPDLGRTLSPQDEAALDALEAKMQEMEFQADETISLLSRRHELSRARDRAGFAILAQAAIDARHEHGPKAKYLRLTTWEDEPDSDGSFDVAVECVCDAEGEDLDGIGSNSFTSISRDDDPSWLECASDRDDGMVDIDKVFQVANDFQVESPKPVRTPLGQVRAEAAVLDGIDAEHICEPRGEARERLGLQPVLLKGAWNQDGTPAAEDVDPRDAYVKVASSKLTEETGQFPSFVQFSELARYREQGLLPYQVEVGR